MQLKFADYNEGEGAELLCPRCMFNYLHHYQIDIFERGEDAATGLHVQVVDGSCTTDTLLRDNPSSRRHGLTVGLWCEGCRARLLLTIAQHKGVTLVDLIDTGEDFE
ncbi:hypothetical protein HEP73_04364 [Xanthomonas sp. GW]|uniref:hypothetical protein n=1 Tax=Xanthomonas TaxID=338 RepID=UPI001639FFAE|nr:MULTISPECIES: hypothetical protein [Xanthomonas]MBN6112443.1 hypothetical protein [Xanthomonas bonasiae]QNH23411.1 hypothetical protein HEP73_04364 [Xanthomonas sp. GW]